MTSQLNVDTIVDKAGSSGPSLPNTTTIKIGNTSTNVSDGGAVTQNTVQGLAKMWVQFDGTGTVGTRDSFNRGGLTDNGTGNYTVTYTNNMNNNDFSVTVSMNSEYTSGGVGIYSGVYACNTADCRVSGRRYNANADSDFVCITVHGDLA